MTTTLKVLRTALGKRLGQPLFRRLGGATLTATGGSTTTLVDTGKLLQADNFWRGQFLYLPATNQVREISAFTQSTKTLTFLEPASATITAGTEYEIWSQFTGVEINDAINEAIRDAWPFFFDVVTDYLVIKRQSGVGYNLQGLAVPVRFLGQVYLEVLVNTRIGVATTTVAQNRLKDTNQIFTSEDIGRTVRIYAGTSTGDFRTITTIVDPNTVEVNSNFTSVLTTTSAYRVGDGNSPLRTWELLTEWNIDKFTNPVTLRLGGHPFGEEGALLRLVYEGEFQTLTTEAATTTCPREYLELASLARIYASKISLAPATEVSNWMAMYRAFADAAQAYALQHRYRHIMSTYTNENHGEVARPSEYPYSG